jgi:hypothetical protein
MHARWVFTLLLFVFLGPMMGCGKKESTGGAATPGTLTNPRPSGTTP